MTRAERLARLDDEVNDLRRRYWAEPNRRVAHSAEINRLLELRFEIQSGRKLAVT